MELSLAAAEAAGGQTPFKTASIGTAAAAAAAAPPMARVPEEHRTMETPVHSPEVVMVVWGMTGGLVGLWVVAVATSAKTVKLPAAHMAGEAAVQPVKV
ncbi:hypothetical protein [Asticcacaulis sp. W401b]|uniref:hypothetical protein n=1 Tax=Asticcacaulis sp. W401b TaxID=3388666 RepID=UPI003970F27B